MMLKMPVVLGKHSALLNSFRTGLGLSFDDAGIDHCHMHRHVVNYIRGQERRKVRGGEAEGNGGRLVGCHNT